MIPATPIPLAYWQDPQGDVLLRYSEHSCDIYYGCWAESGVPVDYVCRLSFYSTSAVRSFPREFTPYSYTPPGHSYLLTVSDSDLLREHSLYRAKHYGDKAGAGASRPTLMHYVVIGHDIYHEILAARFEENRIPSADIADPDIRRLLDYA